MGIELGKISLSELSRLADSYEQAFNVNHKCLIDLKLNDVNYRVARSAFRYFYSVLHSGCYDLNWIVFEYDRKKTYCDQCIAKIWIIRLNLSTSMFFVSFKGD